MMTLTQYLEAEKLTQAQFAAIVGMNQGTVSKLANGEQFPSWEAAKKIAAATDGMVPVEIWATQERRKRRSAGATA